MHATLTLHSYLSHSGLSKKKSILAEARTSQLTLFGEKDIQKHEPVYKTPKTEYQKFINAFINTLYDPRDKGKEEGDKRWKMKKTSGSSADDVQTELQS